MGRVDVDTHGDEAGGLGVQVRGDGTEGLREHAGGASVEQPERLAVPVDRHGRDHPVGTCLCHPDTEPVVQQAVATRLRVGRRALLRHVISLKELS
jgi:hypothetical protein